MSYGEWKTRGKHWAKLEVDSPFRHTFLTWADTDAFDGVQKAERAIRSLERKCHRFIDWDENPTMAKFLGYQCEDKKRVVVEWREGMHVHLFAFDKEHYQSAMDDFAERSLKRHKEAYKVLGHEPTEDANPQIDLKDELIKMFQAMMETESLIDFDYTNTSWHSWVLAMNQGEARRQEEVAADSVETEYHPIW